jgi:hypothetical protein
MYRSQRRSQITRNELIALSDEAKSPGTNSSLSATKPNHPAGDHRSQRRSQITRHELIALSDEVKSPETDSSLSATKPNHAVLISQSKFFLLNNIYSFNIQTLWLHYLH